jgi:hypothetical protein
MRSAQRRFATSQLSLGTQFYHQQPFVWVPDLESCRLARLQLEMPQVILPVRQLSSGVGEYAAVAGLRGRWSSFSWLERKDGVLAVAPLEHLITYPA